MLCLKASVFVETSPDSDHSWLKLDKANNNVQFTCYLIITNFLTMDIASLKVYKLKTQTFCLGLHRAGHDMLWTLHSFLCAFLFIFRCHNSTGDLKHLESSLPSFPNSSSSQGDAQPQGFRRRASTFSHSPTPSSAEYSTVNTLTQTPQDSSTAAKPKLVRHYSVSTDTPHQSK